ncbi:MAG: hypothetical protein ABIH83_03095 [Candidatus Micrarchaeota archaeon]
MKRIPLVREIINQSPGKMAKLYEGFQKGQILEEGPLYSSDKILVNVDGKKKRSIEWSEGVAVEEIWKFYLADNELNTFSIKTNYNRLYKAGILDIFGTPQAALRISGFNPEKIIHVSGNFTAEARLMKEEILYRLGIFVDEDQLEVISGTSRRCKKKKSMYEELKPEKEKLAEFLISQGYFKLADINEVKNYIKAEKLTSFMNYDIRFLENYPEKEKYNAKKEWILTEKGIMRFIEEIKVKIRLFMATGNTFDILELMKKGLLYMRMPDWSNNFQLKQAGLDRVFFGKNLRKASGEYFLSAGLGNLLDIYWGKVYSALADYGKAYNYDEIKEMVEKRKMDVSGAKLYPWEMVNYKKMVRPDFIKEGEKLWKEQFAAINKKEKRGCLRKIYPDKNRLFSSEGKDAKALTPVVIKKKLVPYAGEDSDKKRKRFVKRRVKYVDAIEEKANKMFGGGGEKKRLISSYNKKLIEEFNIRFTERENGIAFMPNEEEMKEWNGKFYKKIMNSYKRYLFFFIDVKQLIEDAPRYYVDLGRKK